MSNPDRVFELTISLDDSANPVLLVGLVPIGSVPGEMPVGDAAGSMMEGTSLVFVESTVSISAVEVSD